MGQVKVDLMTLTIDFDTSDKAQKLLWTTDLHVDAAEKSHLNHFFNEIVQQDPKAILIGGDISNGYQSLIHLQNMAQQLKKPIYFVLGNHDFYYGSIFKMRSKAQQLSQENPNIVYLTGAGVIDISPTTALIGHDGWYDGKAGDFLNSDLLLNDYLLIDELKDLSSEARLAKLNELGAEAAEKMRSLLQEAFRRFDKVILLTHVPPFLESCVHEGGCATPTGARTLSVRQPEKLSWKSPSDFPKNSSSSSAAIHTLRPTSPFSPIFAP